MANRQPKFELLRIFAMFLVLIVHTTYLSHGWPLKDDILGNPAKWTYITFVQSISVVCVNIFVLISGWFGIKPKLKTFISFIFQVFFFLIFSFAMMIAIGKVEVSIKNIATCLTIIDSMWFVWAYLLLYILSPALNAIVRPENQQVLKYLLVAYFSIQIFYSWTGLIGCFDGGYSTLSFIGLYLLARYIREFNPSFAKKSWTIYLAIYLICAFILTFWGIAIAYVPILRDHVPVISSMLFAYNNPIVIIGSISVLLMFYNFSKPKINITSSTKQDTYAEASIPTTSKNIIPNQMKVEKIVLLTGSSAFAAYLLHANPFVLSPIYRPSILALYNLTNSVIINNLSILLFVITVFIMAVLIDQVRKFIFVRFYNSAEHHIRKLIKWIID